MIDALTQPFIEFSFMRRALVGCLALSLGAPPIGVFLMLRRMSLMGDAMSHAILPGAAIGYLLAGLSLFAMSLGGFAAGLAVALSAGLIARSTVLREDASLAAFYLVSLALVLPLPRAGCVQPCERRSVARKADGGRYHAASRCHRALLGRRCVRAD